MDTKILERFSEKYSIMESTCWIWTAGIFTTGYGAIYVDGQNRLAHRLSYEHYRGPISDNLVIDHLCRERSCVNPWHMETVELAENTRRGMATKSRCVHGFGSTQCSECSRENRRNYYRDYMANYRIKNRSKINTLQQARRSRLKDNNG